MSDLINMTEIFMCPKCKSLNWTATNKGIFSVRIITRLYEKRCKDCNYEGIFPKVEKGEFSKKDEAMLEDMKNIKL